MNTWVRWTVSIIRISISRLFLLFVIQDNRWNIWISSPVSVIHIRYRLLLSLLLWMIGVMIGFHAWEHRSDFLFSWWCFLYIVIFLDMSDALSLRHVFEIQMRLLHRSTYVIDITAFLMSIKWLSIHFFVLISGLLREFSCNRLKL